MISYELRDDHAVHAVRNVETFLGERPANWQLVMGDVADADLAEDRSTGWCWTCWRPGRCSTPCRGCWCPGGVLVDLRRHRHPVVQVNEALREQQCWTEPRSWETMQRGWNAVGLAVRPQHAMRGHTAFLVCARRLAEGTVTPTRLGRKRLT